MMNNQFSYYNNNDLSQQQNRSFEQQEEDTYLCPNCQQLFPIAQLEQHEMSCKFKSIPCQYCQECFPKNLLAEHKKMCTQRGQYARNYNIFEEQKLNQQQQQPQFVPPLFSNTNQQPLFPPYSQFLNRQQSGTISNDTGISNTSSGSSGNSGSSGSSGNSNNNNGNQTSSESNGSSGGSGSSGNSNNNNDLFNFPFPLASIFGNNQQRNNSPFDPFIASFFNPPSNMEQQSNNFSIRINDQDIVQGQNLLGNSPFTVFQFRSNSNNPSSNRRNRVHGQELNDIFQSLFTSIRSKRQNQGIKEDQLENYCCAFKFEKLPNLTEEQQKCGICLTDYEEGEDLLVLPCLHRFHQECIQKWLKDNSKCPCCRMNIKQAANQQM